MRILIDEQTENTTKQSLVKPGRTQAPLKNGGDCVRAHIPTKIKVEYCYMRPDTISALFRLSGFE
jgi:hypothetical protein